MPRLGLGLGIGRVGRGGGAAPVTNLLRANSENLTGADWSRAASVLAVYSPGQADPFGTSLRVTALISQVSGAWASVSSPTTHQVNGQYAVISWYVRSGGIAGAATDFRYICAANDDGAQVIANVRIAWASSGAAGAAVASVTGSASVGGVASGTLPVVASADMGGGYYRVSVTVDQSVYKTVNRAFRVNTQPWAGSTAVGNILHVTGVCINAGDTMLAYEPTTAPAGLEAEALPRLIHMSFVAYRIGNSRRYPNAITWSHAGVLSLRLFDETAGTYKDLGSSDAGTSWPASATYITGLTAAHTYFMEYQLALTTKLDQWSDAVWHRVPMLIDPTIDPEDPQDPFVREMQFVLSTTTPEQFEFDSYYPWPE